MLNSMPTRLTVNKEFLNKLYVNDSLSIYQIAPILECHPATVAKKLHEFNIAIKTPSERTIISKSILENLYLRERLSINQIAKQLKCSGKTIRRGMKIYNISLRPRKRVVIEKKILEHLYHRKKLSLQAIGKKYNLTPSCVLRKMRKFNILLRKSWTTNTIHAKKPFTGSLREKAYLIGFRLGDLGVKKNSKNTGSIVVKSNTTKSEQITLMKDLFSKYSPVWISGPNIIGVFHFTTLLHPSFDFLVPKTDCIPDWVKNNTEHSLAFIAGYTDAEGSIGVYDERARFRIGSYDIGILSDINDFFIKLGAKTALRLEQLKGFIDKRGVISNGDFWRISVNEKRSLLMLFDLLLPYLKHEKRISDMLRGRDNINKRNGIIYP